MATNGQLCKPDNPSLTSENHVQRQLQWLERVVTAFVQWCQWQRGKHITQRLTVTLVSHDTTTEKKENPPQQDVEQEQTPDVPVEAVAHLYLYSGTHIYI